MLHNNNDDDDDDDDGDGRQQQQQQQRQKNATHLMHGLRDLPSEYEPSGHSLAALLVYP
jgi:hypothetical protein